MKKTFYSKIASGIVVFSFQLIHSSMTMDLFGLEKEAFIDGIDVGGAVTFLEFAKDADVTLTF